MAKREMDRKGRIKAHGSPDNSSQSAASLIRSVDKSSNAAARAKLASMGPAAVKLRWPVRVICRGDGPERLRDSDKRAS